MWDKGVPCFTESLYTTSDTSQQLMCVHPSHTSQEIALLFERTPLPHTIQGYLGVLPPRVAGPGFGCTSPESSSINGEQSQWQPVTSGIPEGSVLGPLLFLIYINNLSKHVNSTIYMYADDTKIYRVIREKHDQEILQKDFDSLKAWPDQWLLKFHPKKCYSITIGKKEDNDHTYCITDNGTKYDMTQINDMKDIGVIIDSDLKFENQINSKIGTANKILGIIRRSFMYLSAEDFIPLYKAMVRSHFDYAMIIWNPHAVKYIESIEGVQRRATKIVPELKKIIIP